jgi:quercetin dioxygenase-like cupin family protein
MKLFRAESVPRRPADPHTFIGPAWARRIADDAAGTPVGVYHVEFEDGARTNWHRHSGPQWLFVVDGRIRVQAWGGVSVEVSAGDAVAIPPGEKHWHGAAPGARGAHLAVNVDTTTEWLEPVSDADYRQ